MNVKYYRGEIWMPIKGYEGRYDISNFGRVRCHDYRRKGVLKIMKTTAQQGYYIKVALRGDNGKTKYYRVHRLVAEAFLDAPRPEQTQVEHLDCDKHNNNVENLRWTHPKGNMANPLTRYHLSVGHMCPCEETRARMSAGQLRRFARERATKTGRYAPSRV